MVQTQIQQLPQGCRILQVVNGLEYMQTMTQQNQRQIVPSDGRAIIRITVRQVREIKEVTIIFRPHVQAQFMGNRRPYSRRHTSLTFGVEQHKGFVK